MSNIKDLMNRLEKLKNQIRMHEQKALLEAPRPLGVSSDGNSEIDLPLVTCPVCGDLLDCPMENELEPNLEKYAYIKDICTNCGTKYQLGEVTARCSLCQNPFQSLPENDINEFNHHYSRKDGKSYCIPCFIQLFFDEYIDLSSNSFVLNYENTKVIGLPLSTHVGYSIEPYRSRLKANGFEEVITSQEWVDVENACINIVIEGHRYLILSTNNSESQDIEYVVYMKRFYYLQ